MKSRLEAICSLLRSFVEGRDQSLAAAGQLEVALDEEFPEDDEC
jgi:hypothetical protein